MTNENKLECSELAYEFHLELFNFQKFEVKYSIKSIENISW